ncbi:Gfo/Idh/MocA family oxidoreductase [Pseudonocardia lutea]|uniref:Gfo/Idh/MocA family oxidoreductase n=1 Tax=Pseudonocardia lutea TaxID=2172015 RepID=A0ABW1I8X4_9PSEU
MTNERGRRTVGVVGAGVIGRVHLGVLRSFPQVEVVALVNPVRPAEELVGPAAWFPTLGAALSTGAAPDLLVLATPTETHLGLAAEALAAAPGTTVLSEKPLTGDPGLLAAFRRDHAAHLDRLRVVNHFAYSPEVRWALATVEEHGWGPPQVVLADFSDPSVLFPPERRASYVSGWIDSGANQLSMLADFVGEMSVVVQHADPEGMRAVTEVRFPGGRASLVTNWCTGSSSKRTTLRWSGGHELLLDHTAMTGLLLQDGEIRAHLGNDGTVDRKTAHYAGLYRALLADPGDPRLSLDRAATVAALLAAGSGAAPSNGGVRWSTAAF